MPDKKDGEKTDARNVTVKTQLKNVKLELAQYKSVIDDRDKQIADLKRQLKEANDALVSDLSPELDMKLTELSEGKLTQDFLDTKTIEEKQELVKLMSMAVGADKKTPPFRSIRTAGTGERPPSRFNLYLKTDKDIRKPNEAA